jgi:AcrR family transcriptional regulator
MLNKVSPLFIPLSLLPCFASIDAMSSSKKTKLPEKTVRRNVQPERDTPAVAEDATREQILLEAAKLFRHQGYYATTLRQIAAAVGIKAGSIYYHFASKDEILAVVLDTGMERVSSAVRERIDALPPDATFRDKIAAGIEGHLFGLLSHGDFTSANIRIFGQIPQEAKDKHKIVRRAYETYWNRLLTEAIAKGELRSDISASVMGLFVIGALNWTVEWYNPKRGSFKLFGEQIAGMVFDGILDQHQDH